MDYYYDDYVELQDEDDYSDLAYDVDQMPATSMSHLFANCIQPSLVQTAWYMWHLVSWCVVCRILYYAVGNRRPWLHHIIAVLCGLAQLYDSIGRDCLVVVFFAISLYSFMCILDYMHKPKGLLTVIAAIMSHFVYEFVWTTPDDWQRIRGIQMLASMKIISLAFDLDALGKESGGKWRSDQPLPGLVTYLAYILCPFSCILGPWLPFKVYQRGLVAGKESLLRSSFKLLVNVLLAFGFLILSNCLVPVMLPANSWIGFRTYRDALGIRSSHYFICFLSQMTISLSGFQTNVKLFHVTNPWHIELPRSLSSAVRHWNIPMHEWLKQYIYQPLRKRYTKHLVVAVIGTYATSCLLHGIHVPVYLVLVSLACFALGEQTLRRKLANIFDACITANPCRKPCKFRWCTNKPEVPRAIRMLVRTVNVVFGQLAIMHLAYLGIMMTEDSGAQAVDTSVLEKWSNLNYISHWITLVIFGVNFLV